MPHKSGARTWGTRFDSLDSSPPPSPKGSLVALDDAGRKKETKPSHDASIFVGSLPTTLNQDQLSMALTNHLSPYTEIKSVKIVRDIKGAVCAFVQCADAAAATELLKTLTTGEQKPFMNRTLRYEPARAFRTLLISYREPTQWVANSDSSGEGKTVPLDLPWAMHIWRPKANKYFNVAWNDNAVDILSKGWDSQALHLQPVQFDAETLKVLAAHFGPIEHFRMACPPGTPEDADLTEIPQFVPYPHDGPRNSAMEEGCFEVKWTHRDDCVSALMTLRRIPHLTVTWAHQHAQQDDAPYGLERDQANSAAPCPAGFTSPTDANARVEVSSDGWDAPQPLSACTSQNSDTTLVERKATPGWNDKDFPPLGELKNERKTGCGVWGEKKRRLALKEKDELDTDGSTSEILLPTGQIEPLTVDIIVNQAQIDEEGFQDVVQELSIPSTPGLGMSPVTPKSGSLFPPTPIDGDMQLTPTKGFEDQSNHSDGERELDPTTLFIGGLETHGPNAWDEEKISQLFSQYEGLDSVRVVKPPTGHAGFAFVKFNNTESPARAVQEQHNRVYDGRVMRVQLRDCNPPRGNWKNNRGRGRYQHPGGYPGRHYYDRPPSRSRERAAETMGPEAQPTIRVEVVEESAHKELKASLPELDLPTSISELVLFEASQIEEVSAAEPQAPSEVTVEQPPSERGPSPVPGRDSATSVASQEVPNTEHYQEWYEIAPSETSASDPSAFYPPSNMAIPYYPAPWMPPYAQQVPFPIPYYGAYPPYVPHTQGAGTETGQNPPFSAMWSPMGMYGAYIPYPAYSPNPNDQQPTQAPVVPAGFIQNEQGTLIAVYQPDVLDQYMSSGSPGHTSPAPQKTASLPPPPATPTSQAAMPVWNQTSQPPTFNPTPPRLIVPPPPPIRTYSQQTSPARSNMGWIPTSQSSVSLVPPSQPPIITTSTSMPLPPMQTFFRSPVDVNGVPFANRRQGANRRDHNNGNSFHGPRGRGNGRRGRGGGTSPGLVPHGDGYGRSMQFGNSTSPSGGDWNHWASVR